MLWEGGTGADVFIHKGWEWGIIEGWRGHEKRGKRDGCCSRITDRRLNRKIKVTVQVLKGVRKLKMGKN